MVKMIITFDRQSCIGAGACEVVDPEHWKIVSDGKADLINDDPKPVQKDGKWVLELDGTYYDKAKYEKAKEAESACPAQAIKVEKVE
ncbi:ferredoxin [Candidatus Woesearchaeota archaeon]|nr:ferredoxin [Candidatus Woesearchaeota archaeon]